MFNRAFDDSKLSVKKIAKLSVQRLSRINKSLQKYKSAMEIIKLLKKLQMKYNPEIFLHKKGSTLRHNSITNKNQ